MCQFGKDDAEMDDSGGAMMPKSSIRVDRGLVQEHDRNVVLDRIHAPAARTLERFSLRHYRNLAFRTDQNIEQFFVDHVGILHPASLPSGTIAGLPLKAGSSHRSEWMWPDPAAAVSLRNTCLILLR